MDKGKVIVTAHDRQSQMMLLQSKQQQQRKDIFLCLARSLFVSL